MASSPANSQATNDDPAGPLSSAHHATVTITPYNAEARLAFSDVVDWLLETSQADEAGAEEGAQASCHVSISSRQVRDEEVGRLLEQIQTGHLSSSSPSSSGQHDPTPVTDLGKYIHTGCYFVDLSRSPAYRFRGWTAGRRSIKSRNDFILCLENSTLHGIRQHHAAFQVHEIGRILVRKISDRGVVEVDGEALGSREFRLFNKHSSFIRLGQLKYEVTYTRHSATEEHTAAMSEYIRTSDGIPRPVDLSMTPTPAPGNGIQVGRWTLSSAGTVGIGGSGRVSVGVGHTGEVVALKRMSVANVAVPNNAVTLLTRRQKTLETLTQLTDATKKDRIVRLLEVITDDPKAANASADVWFALTPFTPKTLAQYKGPFAPRMVRTMTISLLEAIDFLHSHSWIHGDIKPMNIGVRQWDSDQASIVLLDTEDAIYAPDGYTLPKPGTTGTIGWLSPERELDRFTATVDVWAAGVAAIWMLLGRHPWQFRQNPWRYEDENEKQRPLFHAAYDTVTRDLVTGEDIDLGKAILQMVRHPYARTDEQRKARPPCREVVQILSAGNQKAELLDGPSQKRIRVEA